MSLKIEMYERKEFPVEVVEVTDSNMQDVAEWCHGDVLEEDKKGEKVSYVRVRVHRPLSLRQTQAYVGDFVLYAGTGFKVYQKGPFRKAFRKVPEEVEHSDNRSSITGEFVSQEFAEENPDTTVHERAVVDVRDEQAEFAAQQEN